MTEAEQLDSRNYMQLQFLSCSENESFARVVVASFVARLDPTLEELSDVKTAVSEAVTNAVIHGYSSDDTDQLISLTAEISGRKLTITISDNGVGIEDIEQVREPLYTSKPSLERSGMGFTIMENFMDDLVIDSVPGKGTMLTMSKQFAPILHPVQVS